MAAALDQSRAPVLEALQAHHEADRLSFAPPGHRQGRGADPRARAVLGDDVYRNDMLATGGLDDRASRGGVIERAQALMAEAVGAETAFFSTCGSSLSVKSSMLAVAGSAGRLLLGRDAHKSAVAGLVLGGIEPVWLRPTWDRELHLAHPPAPEAVAAALERAPDVGGVMVTSPTPYGTCADLESLVEVCHAHDKPLLVDEAWGAHLPFHERLPTWAMDAGADLCVVSVHKMGAGLEQGSVFHVQGDRIDVAHLAACADMLSSTSPNVLLYAAMDGWRRQMVEQGHQLLDAALSLADETRRQIEAIDGLDVPDDELLGREASHDLDWLDILVQVDGLGVSGFQAADWLRSERHIDVHLSDATRVEAQISIADTSSTVARLVEALRDLSMAAEDFPTPPTVDHPDPADLELEMAMAPRDAFYAATEDVTPDQAVGRVAAEQVTPYPPGIPVLLPGEVIGREVVEYLLSAKRAGAVTPDPARADLSTFRVVA